LSKINRAADDHIGRPGSGDSAPIRLNSNLKLIVEVSAAVMSAVSGDHRLSQAVPLRDPPHQKRAHDPRLTEQLGGRVDHDERIVPLYWLMTAGLILTFLLAPKLLNVPIEGWRSIVTSFFFIPDLRGNGEVRPIMALGWSLNYEMFFYAVFAVCLLAPLRRAALYLTGFFVGIAILGATLKPQSIALAYWTDSIVLEFLVGALLALACRAKFMIGAAAAWGLIALGVALAVALGPFWGMDQILPRCVSDGLPAMLIVAAAAFGPRLSASWIVTPLVVLGDASYSLYLTHPFAIRPMLNIWMALDGGALPFSLYVMLCLLAAIAAALVVYRWIERPITDVLPSRLGSGGTSRPRRLAGAQPQSAAAGG
jgi:exopolysaccharide production protein ExoZ